MFLRSCINFTRLSSQHGNSQKAHLLFNKWSIRSIFFNTIFPCSTNVARLIRVTSLITSRGYSGSSKIDDVNMQLLSSDGLKLKARKYIKPLSKDAIKLDCDKTQVLLLTANNNEHNAVLSFLEPLDNRKTLVQYHHIWHEGNIRQGALYIFGKYGAFNAAVQLMSKQGPYAAKNAIFIANNCFGKQLHAVFAVGVACGMEQKNKLLDVLVSEKVSFYDSARIGTVGNTEEVKITQRAARNSPTSDFFVSYFKLDSWVSNSVNAKGETKYTPKMHMGNILSGNYLIDNKEVKIVLRENFDPEAIGIEMEGGGLYNDYSDGKCNLQIMIVKGVCDFGDGNKNKQYQPTAALLAADCVRHYLDDETLPVGLSNWQGFDTAENKKYSKLKAHLKYFIVFCINIWYVLKIKEYIEIKFEVDIDAESKLDIYYTSNKAPPSIDEIKENSDPSTQKQTPFIVMNKEGINQCDVADHFRCQGIVKTYSSSDYTCLRPYEQHRFCEHHSNSFACSIHGQSYRRF